MNRFKSARESAGISQKSAAISVGVQPPSMSDWESGRSNPTSDKLVKLADLYGVTVDYLLGRDEPKGALRLSGEERDLLLAYRQATADTRRAVRAVLGVADQMQDGRAISG